MSAGDDVGEGAGGGERGGDADEGAHSNTDSGGAEDEAEDIGAHRSQGHADAEFVGALDDGVGDDTVESDAGEEKREGGEGSKEPGDELAPGVFGLGADPVLEEHVGGQPRGVGRG